MNKIKLILFIIVVSIKNSFAVNVGNITEIISSDESTLAKEIENTVNTARLVNLTIEKLDSPHLENGKVIPVTDPNEILNQHRLIWILPGHASDVFKIIYQGPKDDKERYYRLNWKDDPIAEKWYNTKLKISIKSNKYLQLLVQF